MQLKKHLLFIFCFVFLISIAFANEQLIIEPNAGRTPILQAIRQAHSSIDLVMYGLTDGRLMNALIAAKERGINVRVMLEPHPYLATSENRNAIRQLKNAGISYHDANPDFKLTHQKTLIVDHHSALIMTFNFTQSAFKNQRNFALEITDENELNEIEKVFIADRNHQGPKITHPNLLWSPNNSREKIQRLLNEANTSVFMYAPSLSDYQIVGNLAKTAKRGVRVEILMSQDSFEKSAKKIAYLQRYNVQIRSSKPYQIHAKVLIIDAKKVMLGSINFTKASVEKNRELSIVSQDANVSQELTKIFNQDWDNSGNSYQAIYFLLKQKYAKKLEKKLVRSLQKNIGWNRSYHHHETASHHPKHREY